MNANEFVEALAESAPSFEDLINVGLKASEAENFRDSYICTQRRDPLLLDASNDIFDLVSHWDISKIEIGMVKFLETPRKRDFSVQIGVVEADPLLIVKSNSELLVENAEAPDRTLWRVAHNPSMFLDALVISAKFLGERTVGIIDFDDLESAKLVARKCAERAGGDMYIEFYYMLLGAE